MARPVLLVRIYGSVENARAAMEIEALRNEIRRMEQEKTNEGQDPKDVAIGHWGEEKCKVTRPHCWPFGRDR